MYLTRARASDMEDWWAQGRSVAPELVLLPLLVSVRQSQGLAISAAAIILAVALLRNRSAPPTISGPGWPAVALSGAVALVLVGRGSKTLTLVTAAVIATAYISGRKSNQAQILRSLDRGLVLYILANIAGWLAGISSPADAVRIAGFQSSAGIFAQRVIFPFSSSINEAPIVVAIFFGYIGGRLAHRHPLRASHWIGMAGGGVILLAANSRFPLLVIALLLIAVTFAPRLTHRALVQVAVLALAAPFYLEHLKGFLGAGAAVLIRVPYIARDQSVENLAGLGTRGEIWRLGTYWWSQTHIDSAERLVGFGQAGHVDSGAVYLYADLYGRFLSKPEALTMHNSFLQVLYDGGLVGLALLALGLGATAVRWRRAQMTPVVMMLGAAALTGAVEASLSPGLSTTPFLVVLTLAVLAPAQRPGDKGEPGSDVPNDTVDASGATSCVVRTQ